MALKKLVFLVLLINPLVFLIAQNVIIKGFVKDSLQNSLANATLLYKKEDSAWSFKLMA